jgi:hypothetical protein
VGHSFSDVIVAEGFYPAANSTCNRQYESAKPCLIFNRASFERACGKTALRPLGHRQLTCINPWRESRGYPESQVMPVRGF